MLTQGFPQHGFSYDDIYLVDPKRYTLGGSALALVGADDLLESGDLFRRSKPVWKEII